MDRSAKKSPGHKWEGPLPKGWTDASRKKFWNSLTGEAPKHKVTECIKRMKGKVGNPGAFCAALADRVIPGWRAEAAKERRKKKARDLLRSAACDLEQPLRTRRDYGEQDEDDDRAPRHSKLPGVDSLPMEEDPRVELEEEGMVASWITREAMEKLCPSCAERMKQAGITRVRESVVREALLEAVSPERRVARRWVDARPPDGR